MLKLYVNSWPQRDILTLQEFETTNFHQLLKSTEVEVVGEFDFNDAIRCMFLLVLDKLCRELKERDIHARVGFTYGHGYRYNGWLVVVETRGNILPILCRYFEYNRQETQDQVTFEELMNL